MIIIRENRITEQSSGKESINDFNSLCQYLNTAVVPVTGVKAGFASDTIIELEKFLDVKAIFPQSIKLGTKYGVTLTLFAKHIRMVQNMKYAIKVTLKDGLEITFYTPSY